MQCIRFVVMMLLLLSLSLMTACGGGGGTNGPPTISGVAATGAPIRGTVTLKDSSGVVRGPVNTDDDGQFSFDVTGLTPPFFLKADFTKEFKIITFDVSGHPTYLPFYAPYTLYSVTTASGIAHINPLSDLAFQIAAGTDPSSVFGAEGSNPGTTKIDDAKLNDALSTIKTLLSPLLTEYGITDFDPIKGAYSATPNNKLDAMLDVISIMAQDGTLTISNWLNGSTIVSGDIANIATLTLEMANSPSSAVLTDLAEISQRLTTLCSIMNLGEALTASKTEGLFIPDPYYGTSSGHTRAEDMASIVAIFGPGGTNSHGKLKSIRNVKLINDLTANYPDRGVSKVYLLNYDFIFEDGVVVHGNNVTFAREISTGLWKFIGDPFNQGNVGTNYGSENYGFFISGDIPTLP